MDGQGAAAPDDEEIFIIKKFLKGLPSSNRAAPLMVKPNLGIFLGIFFSKMLPGLSRFDVERYARG